MDDLFVVLGHPVGHSLSPIMHRAAFRSLGIAADYLALDARDFDAAWSAIRRLEVWGGNVTVPWKEAAALALDVPSPTVLELGSANTFWREPDGRMAGAETDGVGFVAALREAFGIAPAGLRTLVLGAGGGARAVVAALAREGAASIGLWNRTPGRAGRIVELVLGMGYRGRLAVLGEDLPGVPGDRPPGDGPTGGEPLDLIVNATSTGLSGHPLNLDRSLLCGLRFAMDLVYGREPTPFLRTCGRAGARTADGRGMLLHQGARAFELWMGRPAPLEIMRSALARALSAPV